MTYKQRRAQAIRRLRKHGPADLDAILLDNQRRAASTAVCSASLSGEDDVRNGGADQPQRAHGNPIRWGGSGSNPERSTKNQPRAIVDSDTAHVGAADSTPELQRLASVGAGDAGSNPAHAGSPGTPGVTVGAIPTPGACPDCGAPTYEAQNCTDAARNPIRVIDCSAACGWAESVEEPDRPCVCNEPWFEEGNHVCESCEACVRAREYERLSRIEPEPDDGTTDCPF